MFLTKTLQKMKVKILERRQFKGRNSKEFNNYQISFEGRKVWVSELDYTKHIDLITFENEYIILKDLVEDNFIIKEKENKKGKFLSLIPKNKSELGKNDKKRSELDKLLNQLGTDSTRRITDKDLIDELMEEEANRKADFENQEQIVNEIEVPFEEIEVLNNNQVKEKDFINEVLESETKESNINHKDNANKKDKVSHNTEQFEFSENELTKIIFTAKKNEKLNNAIQVAINNLKSINFTNIDFSFIADKYYSLTKNVFSEIQEHFIALLNKLEELQIIIQESKTTKENAISICLIFKYLGRFNEVFEKYMYLTLYDIDEIDFLINNYKIVSKVSLALHKAASNEIFKAISNLSLSSIEIKKEDENKFKHLKDSIDNFNIVFGAARFIGEVLKGKITLQEEKKSNSSYVAEKSSTPLPINSKVAFINGLIKMSNRKDVSEKTKDRLIELVSKEVGGNEEILNEIYNDVKEIKNHIVINPPLSPPPAPNKRLSHNPKTLVEYLYKFSSDERLKWLTHFKESDFEYLSILDEAKKTFKTFKKTLIPKDTFYNIQNFIFGNKDKKYPSLKLYGNKNIYLDWSSEEVIEWCKINPGVYPNDLLIPKEKQYPIANNKNFLLLKFGDVIKEFKHYIEIRTDDEQRTFDLRLSDLMRRVGLYTDFNEPEFDELFKSVNVYTDTNLLFQGFEQIFNWCLNHRAKSNRIEILIDSESESDFYLLKIKHIGSKIGYEKESSKLNGLGGDLNKVRQWFFNICDWEIHAKLSDGKSYRIELLNSNVNTLEKPSLITEIEPVDGVIHIVKLYKTVNQ